MFIEYIERLRGKSVAERRAATMTITTSLTGFVVFIWLVSMFAGGNYPYARTLEEREAAARVPVEQDSAWSNLYPGAKSEPVAPGTLQSFLQNMEEAGGQPDTGQMVPLGDPATSSPNANNTVPLPPEGMRGATTTGVSSASTSSQAEDRAISSTALP